MAKIEDLGQNTITFLVKIIVKFSIFHNEQRKCDWKQPWDQNYRQTNLKLHNYTRIDSFSISYAHMYII